MAIGGMIVRGLIAAGQAIRAAAQNPVVRRAAVRAAQQAQRSFHQAQAGARQLCRRAQIQLSRRWQQLQARWRPPLSPQQQAGHVNGTPQYLNRIRARKPTSYFDDAPTAERLTREAWRQGCAVPGRPNVRDHDFGTRVGTGPQGGSQHRVRVHQDRDGRIHGHPSGPQSSNI